MNKYCYIAVINGENNAKEVIDHESSLPFSSAKNVMDIEAEVRKKLMKINETLYSNCTILIQPIPVNQVVTHGLAKVG